MRLLIADDERMDQRILERSLESEVEAIGTANNGLEALYAIRDGLSGDAPWDVIILDLQMPVLGGLDTATLIRETERMLGEDYVGRTAILFTSCSGNDREICKSFFSTGASGFIKKPYDKDDLVRALYDCRATNSCTDKSIQ